MHYLIPPIFLTHRDSRLTFKETARLVGLFIEVWILNQSSSDPHSLWVFSPLFLNSSQCCCGWEVGFKLHGWWQLVDVPGLMLANSPTKWPTPRQHIIPHKQASPPWQTDCCCCCKPRGPLKWQPTLPNPTPWGRGLGLQSLCSHMLARTEIHTFWHSRARRPMYRLPQELDRAPEENDDLPLLSSARQTHTSIHGGSISGW